MTFQIELQIEGTQTGKHPLPRPTVLSIIMPYIFNVAHVERISMEFQVSIPRGSLHASIQMEVDPSMGKGLDPWSSSVEFHH